MGAKDVFNNPKILDESYNGTSKADSFPIDTSLPFSNGRNETGNAKDGNREVDKLDIKGDKFNSIEEEWHQKYAFIIGLLRKPHNLLVRDSLLKQKEKFSTKLKAYRLEKNLIREGITKLANQNGKESNTVHSLSSQVKHLDMMCLTLQRKIDVLGNVDLALPPTENIYSGEPDSLDGTSSEIILNEDFAPRMQDEDLHHSSSKCNTKLMINGRSPLDALAMLHLERCAHRETRKELKQLQKKYEMLRDEFDSGEGISQATSLLFSNSNDEWEDDNVFNKDVGCSSGNLSFEPIDDDMDALHAVRHKDMTLSHLRSRLIHLEKSCIDKLPIDAVKEIARLHSTLVQLERVRDELTLQNFTLKSKLAELSSRITGCTTYRLERYQDDLKDNGMSRILNQNEPCTGRTVVISSPNFDSACNSDEDATNNHSSEMKLRRKSTYKVAHNDEKNIEMKHMRALINDLQTKELEYQNKISEMTTELRNVTNAFESESIKRIECENLIISLEEKCETLKRMMQVVESRVSSRDDECTGLKLDLSAISEENDKLKGDLHILHAKVEKEQSKSMEKVMKFEKELGSIIEQNKILQEDCNRERILRKMYHNRVEELKGKIRVFCRVRPLSKSEKHHDIIVKCCDPYTIIVDSIKGLKEFQFDRVFSSDEPQDRIFQDTKNLIQSAFDGYNVCICAYGQTGSGKTFTILGDESHPGIAPRTFSEIFRHAKEIVESYDVSVSFYVLELYNDKLIDLLNPNSPADRDKLEIRKDRRGTVWIAGARVLTAENSSSLEKTFRQALSCRHTAATKMNDRSSRSHLIIGLIIENTSKLNGTVLRGKISLVDLAGSERTEKSGVSAETLREANSINKSLSALGDVINALTTEQSFVPYRNNKLTQLMQDSIGGNAKTLMFVNISPSTYNIDETLISLNYASRVKQVTNGATRNADSKEIARLKNAILKLKKGELVEWEEI